MGNTPSAGPSWRPPPSARARIELALWGLWQDDYSAAARLVHGDGGIFIAPTRSVAWWQCQCCGQVRTEGPAHEFAPRYDGDALLAVLGGVDGTLRLMHVTHAVQDAVDSGLDELPVTNSALGADPRPGPVRGAVKRLWLAATRAEVDGSAKTFLLDPLPENDVLNLTIFSSSADARAEDDAARAAAAAAEAAAAAPPPDDAVAAAFLSATANISAASAAFEAAIAGAAFVMAEESLAEETLAEESKEGIHTAPDDSVSLAAASDAAPVASTVVKAVAESLTQKAASDAAPGCCAASNAAPSTPSDAEETLPAPALPVLSLPALPAPTAAELHAAARSVLSAPQDAGVALEALRCYAERGVTSGALVAALKAAADEVRNSSAERRTGTVTVGAVPGLADAVAASLYPNLVTLVARVPGFIRSWIPMGALRDEVSKLVALVSVAGVLVRSPAAGTPSSVRIVLAGTEPSITLPLRE